MTRSSTLGDLLKDSLLCSRDFQRQWLEGSNKGVVSIVTPVCRLGFSLGTRKAKAGTECWVSQTYNVLGVVNSEVRLKIIIRLNEVG